MLTEKLWRWTIQQLILIVLWFGLIRLMVYISFLWLIVGLVAIVILISALVAGVKAIKLYSLYFRLLEKNEISRQSGLAIALATTSFVIVHLVGFVFVAALGWLVFNFPGQQ